MKREWWADGPEDDPDERALEAIAADDDFKEKFAAEHAAQLIGLIETSTRSPNLLAARVERLKAAWYAAQDDELKNRRDV